MRGVPRRATCAFDRLDHTRPNKHFGRHALRRALSSHSIQKAADRNGRGGPEAAPFDGTLARALPHDAHSSRSLQHPAQAQAEREDLVETKPLSDRGTRRELREEVDVRDEVVRRVDRLLDLSRFDRKALASARRTSRVREHASRQYRFRILLVFEIG